MNGEYFSGPARVQEAWEKLCHAWEDSAAEWHDSVSQRLGEQITNEATPEIRQLVERMQSLGVLFRRVEQEVRE